MWPKRQNQKRRIMRTLRDHSQDIRPMPGIVDANALETLAMQFVASTRREDYYQLIQEKHILPLRANPNSLSFQAERAVVYHLQNGNIEEAAWLIFLMTHLAKPIDTGWLRLQDIYGMLSCGIWDWPSVSRDPANFTDWLGMNWQNVRGRFGSHRKYESLRPDVNRNMARVVENYVSWIGPAGHEHFFAHHVRRAGNDPATIFTHLYHNMQVISFGRLAKFDYLAMIGRFHIAPVQAGSAFLRGATGPIRGARLLFDGRHDSATPANTLQTYLDDLDTDLGAGMTVMEDALCNWQKNAAHFVHFRG